MIEYALANKPELEPLLAQFIVGPNAVWWSPYPYLEAAKIADDTWGKLQLVSKHDGKIQGYLSAVICRSTDSIDNLSVCKFCEGRELEMAADIATVFRFLQKHFRSIRWSVIAGAPTEPIFRKIVSEFGGREVGVFTGNNRLSDGRLADTVWFQVPGNPYPDGVTRIPAELSSVSSGS